MAEQRWWKRVVAALEREYERRIRRASQVSDYGAAHHDSHDDGEAAVIMNVPRGTRLRAPASPPPQSPQASQAAPDEGH